jgi:hypothetical protein
MAGIRGQPSGCPRIRATSPQHAVCPYRGLAVFDETDAPFFFGREADTQHLLEKLRTQRFLAVIEPSGSGKSSFVRAGVLPTLWQDALPNSEGWTYLVFRPGARPLDELAVGLACMKHIAQVISASVQSAGIHVARSRSIFLSSRSKDSPPGGCSGSTSMPSQWLRR